MKINGMEIPERWGSRYRCLLEAAADNGGEFVDDQDAEIAQLIEDLSQAEAVVAKLRVKPEDGPVRCSYCGIEICKKKDWDAEEKKDFDALDDQYHRRQLEGRLGEKYEAPVSEDYHFEDGAIMDALVGTTYLKGEVERFLRHATTGTKWSLYRAVAKLIAARAGKEQYNG